MVQIRPRKYLSPPEKKQLVTEYLAMPRNGRRLGRQIMKAFCRRWGVSACLVYTLIKRNGQALPQGMQKGKITVGWSNLHVGADYSDEEREFMLAMDEYKHRNQRPYPTWREVLAVLKGLGYRRPDADEAGNLAHLRLR